MLLICRQGTILARSCRHKHSSASIPTSICYASPTMSCRLYSGDVRKGGGSFSKKEQAQEDQYFRQREREEIEKYRQELAKKSADTSVPKSNSKDATKNSKDSLNK